MSVEQMYQEIILDHYREKHHSGLRDGYDAEVHHVNPSCGDELTLRVHLDGENATKADRWDMGERIRAVRTGPDGALWLLEDGTNGRMLRLTPKR